MLDKALHLLGLARKGGNIAIGFVYCVHVGDVVFRLVAGCKVHVLGKRYRLFPNRLAPICLKR